MKKSKLFLLLQQLGREERKFVADYFCQPYFSQKHQHLQALLNYLFKNNKQQAIDSKTIFAHLFGEELQYDDLKMRHAIADVLHHVEIALVHYHAQTDDELWLPLQLLLLYDQMDLPKHGQAALLSAKRALDTYSYRPADYFLHQYRYFTTQMQFADDRTDPAIQVALAQASNALDIFYMIDKLRMTAKMKTLQQIRQTDNHIALADTILSIITEQPHYLEHILLAAYYYICQMLYNPDNPIWFDGLKKLIHAEQLPLPFAEAQEIYFFALNYCAVQINRGREAYLSQTFDLYQLGLQNKWLLEDKSALSTFHYKNMTTVALRLQQYEWVKRFLHDYRPLLPLTQRDTAFTYNLANYHFHRHEYGQVLPLLQQVSHDEIFYSLDARLLLLKTYYELDEVETLLSLVESTIQLLNRTKQLSRERQQTYRNFLKFIRKLSCLPPKATKKMIALRQEIQQTAHLADKRWLLLQLGG